jgi:hypothetical protein
VCKIGSVLLNLLIWDQHASPIQLCFLSMGLAGGSLFQQAPLRSSAKPPAAVAQEKHSVSPTEKQQPLRVSTAGTNGSSGQLVHKREGRVSGPAIPSDKP